MARIRPISAPLLSLLLLLPSAAPAAPAPAPVFEKDIRPLLKAHCFHCHGEGGKKEAGLDLRLRRFMLQQTEDGAATVMVPGNPHASRMLDLAKKGKMPKGEKQLTPAEISLLESWITAGAPTRSPEPESIPNVYITEDERNFWSFRPIAKPPVPPNGEPNPIDAFIAEKLRAAGLDFLPEADPATLARRMSFTLTGLPPEPSTFSETNLSTLLSSPHYGERWARHWLDAAGYADSEGQEEDNLRLHAWHYRDYVVKAHNDDMPWDRFLTEQLAGDELAKVKHDTAQPSIHQPDTEERLAATGFLRMAPDPTGGSVPDANLARNQVIAETIKIVSTSTLGLTIGCAQCHDHRYDPVSQLDYYRLRAVFEPLYDWKNWRSPNQRLYSLYTNDERQEADKIEAEAQKMDGEAKDFALKRLEEIFAERLAKVPDADRAAVKTARETEEGKRTPAQVELLKQYVEANVPKHEGLLMLFDVTADNKRKEMAAKAATHRATKPKENFVMAATETGAAPDTQLFHRGDHEQPREKVQPAILEVLSPGTPAPLTKPAGSEIPGTGRRLAFAQWVTSPGNPLTARVLVNRFWMHHFGRGLVRTPGDFGTLGEPPTHPELLDWLAADFIGHGWQLKRLHRLILTSKTWRQRSDPRATADRERLYCGWKLQRLDAESVRDAMLSVAGKLNPALGGEPVSVARDVQTGRIVPGKEVINPGNGMVDKIDSVADGAQRRSLYIQNRRSRPLTVLDTFDLPVMNPNCTVRSLTTVAPQSLLLMNDAFTVDLAKALAERLQKEAPANDLAKITRAWSLLYNTSPNELDSARSLVFLHHLRSDSLTKTPDRTKAAAEALTAWCQVMLSTNRFLYVD